MRGWTIGLSVLLIAGCAGNSGPPLAHGKPVEHWVQSLKDPEPRARKRAADVLGNIGASDPAVVGGLAAAVQDRDRSVREAAVQALVKMGPAAKEAEGALTIASKDGDPRVRALAVKGLERLRSENR
jgi:HEAT repeat protein